MTDTSASGSVSGGIAARRYAAPLSGEPKRLVTVVALIGLFRLYAPIGSPVQDITVELTPERIARVVSDYYNVPMDVLQGQKRDKAIVMPRQIAMFLMREETDVSLLRIGAELGGRDHSTVLHACEKINREITANDEMRREIAAVRELIYAD